MTELWTRLNSYSIPNKGKRKGKKVFDFHCNICNRDYHNCTNAAAHVKSCQERFSNLKKVHCCNILEAFGQVDVQKEDFNFQFIFPKSKPNERISQEHQSLIELIADLNIPYTQFEAPAWERFIHSLNPKFEIPHKDKLRELIIEHASVLLFNGLEDLRGRICGLAVDGATLLNQHTYAYILIEPTGLRLAGLQNVEVQSSSTLAKATSSIIKECKKHNITISGIVSDNAANLKSALTNNDPHDPNSIKSMIGEAFLRIACAAHTSQLCIHDLIQDLPFLQDFLNNVVDIIHYLMKISKEFKKYCPLKIPNFMSVRWNTLSTCARFILDNRSIIDNLLQTIALPEFKKFEKNMELFQQKKINKEPERPNIPSIFEIPIEWETYTVPLEVLAEFTEHIEGDIVLQQEVLIHKIIMESQLEQMATEGKNAIADQLLEVFRRRFKQTADITVSELAYIFTPNGLNQFRMLNDNKDKHQKRKILKKTFLDITKEATEKNPTPDFTYLPALFDYYLDSFKYNEGENPTAFWKSQIEEEVIIPHVNESKPIPLNAFATTILCIISLPASEAMCERAFSALKSIISDLNTSMKPDLYHALATIKLALRYQRKYVKFD